MELILKEKDLEEISNIIKEFPLKYGIQVLDFLNNKHALQEQKIAKEKEANLKKEQQKEEVVSKEEKKDGDLLEEQNGL
jgi:hypothetical protein